MFKAIENIRKRWKTRRDLEWENLYQPTPEGIAEMYQDKVMQEKNFQTL